jgi:hypothetical protein
MSNLFEKNANADHFISIFKMIKNDGFYQWIDTGHKYYKKATPNGDTPFLIVPENRQAYKCMLNVTPKSFHKWIGRSSLLSL